MSEKNESEVVKNGDHQEADKSSESSKSSHSDSSDSSESSSDNQVELGELVQRESDDAKVVEDGGKEDAFVDAADELTVGSDGRNAESVSVTESQESLEEEKHNDPEFHTDELDNRTEDHHHSKDEMERMQAMLESSVSEKESMVREYKEERETFAEELTYLYQQLKCLIGQRSLLGENDGPLADHLHKDDIEEDEGNTQVPETPVRDMINECSNYLESALKERLETEGSIRELHAILSMKDQEIEDLHAKVSELSVSREVVSSYMDSMSSEVELEKNQHIEVVTNKMIASLAMIIDQQVLDDSLAAKISHVEECMSLIEKYNQILSEIDQLRHSLSGPRSDLNIREEFGTIFVSARDELLELKRKEVEFVEKLSQLEDENRKLVEQIDKEKVMVETTNSELVKTKIELEQEKVKCANTKEKLSLAVTKGKALVQKRDSLRQSLADKTSEFEKCLIELQEKSGALEAAEQSKGNLVESENLVASLQEMLSQRNTILQNFEGILSQTSIPKELQSMDTDEKFRWFVDDRDALKGMSLEFHKLRDVLSAIDLPEAFSSTDLESRVGWLRESFYQAKDELNMLQDEIARTKEAANIEIGRLSASLSATIQEKDYLQMESDDLICKYREIVEKQHQVSSEKDQMVKLLLDVSGAAMDDQEGGYEPNSDISMIIQRCFGKIKEQCRASFESSCFDVALFERIQNLLYVKDQELMLCKTLLEEEMRVRSEVDNLSNELRVASQELEALKEEKGSLQKDLERSEEKSTLLREKLSMAVKKGKGLVQDRENLKQFLDEKNSEIEKLRLGLQQQESVVADCRDQINRLSTDLQCVPLLEGELVSMQDQRNQLEQSLLESNNMLHKVIESIDGLVLPVDSVFEEPVEKVRWLAGYFNECRDARICAEQELLKVTEEASILASKLAEAQEAVKSLDDALSIAENNASQLAEEKREIEVGKTNAEQEMQKAIEEAYFQASKFTEACATRKSLEDAMSLAESNISVLINEKEEAQVGKAAAETELERMKEKVATQTSNLAEAYKSIRSLEDALLQVESNVTLLSEQNSDSQVKRTNLENDLKKLQVDAESQGTKLADASRTIKSLEDALLKAGNDVSMLEGEKKIAEQEVLMLNSKLNACMEELAGTNGTLESRSVELIDQINNFQALVKDETLLSIAKQCFETKLKSLKDMDIILKNMKDQFANMGLQPLQNHPVKEEESNVSIPFPDSFDNIVNAEMDNGDVNPADSDKLPSYLRKTLEGFHLRNKILADKFLTFSSYIDDLIAALFRKLQATSVDATVMFEHMESLKQKAKNMDIEKQELENTITMLEKDIMILLSACTDATKELQFEAVNNLLEVSSVPELENLNHGLFPDEREVGGDAMVDNQENLDNRKYVNTAEKLIFATRKVQTLTKQFESTRNMADATIEDLQNKLKETRTASEKAIEERNLNQNRVFHLESEIEALQSLCNDLRLKLEDYQSKEDKLQAREAELSSLHDTLLMKEQEAEVLLSASQVETLFDKIGAVEIPSAESEIGDLEPLNSAHIKKLFYIVDSFNELQHQTNLLFHDKEELQSTLATQILEIEHLKEEIEKHACYKQDSEKMKSGLSELTYSLEKIIHMLGSNSLAGDQKSADVKGLLIVLETQVGCVLSESANTKSEVQDLTAKLLGSQLVVDDLSTKVKLLEDSLTDRTSPPEIVQERSILEAPPLPTGSEISEIEDAVSLGKNGIPPVTSAAHVRTLRKGSADHLAINVGSESEHLINSEETDEDKGHAFKSLNTSGLIPKQGKLIADRIDGIWVSGGRSLMSRPRARLGLIAYWLFLHIWLLGTIL